MYVISRICMYYFIVPSGYLHSGISTIIRSKEKNAFMLQCMYITDKTQNLLDSTGFGSLKNVEDNA
jgi:hypothetical protein